MRVVEEIIVECRVVSVGVLVVVVVVVNLGERLYPAADPIARAIIAKTVATATTFLDSMKPI